MKAAASVISLTADEQNSVTTPKYLKLRGYRIENRAAKVCEFDQPGEYRR